MRIVIVLALGVATGCITDPGLIVERTGDGEGGVVSSPSGLDCGPTCGALFPPESEVVLTATALTGSEFLGWVGGGCSGTEPCSVRLGDDAKVEARFGRVMHALHVDVAGDGMVHSLPVGITCGVDCDEEFQLGTTVVLQAKPLNTRFRGWTGADCAGPECTIVMDGDHRVGVVFEPVRTFEVRVTHQGAGIGQIVAPGIDCWPAGYGDCAETYVEDTVVTFSAAPAPDARFVGWGINGCLGNTFTCTARITHDLLLSRCSSNDRDRCDLRRPMRPSRDAMSRRSREQFSTTMRANIRLDS